jgi:hypothetical protein
VKGKTEAISLCELIWRRSADLTDLAATASMLKAPRMRLRLRYNGQELIRSRKNEAILVGRGQTCEIVLSDSKASREHCIIEARRHAFIIQDHSTNGTYVTVEGEEEALVQREELTLREHGWIAFGNPRDSASDVLEYFCEPDNS